MKTPIFAARKGIKALPFIKGMKYNSQEDLLQGTKI